MRTGTSNASQSYTSAAPRCALWAAPMLCAAVVALVPSDVTAGDDPITSAFDPDKPVHLAATVTRVAWVNPHIFIDVDVPDANGAVVKWTIDGESPYALILRGWRKDVVAPGTIILVDGYQARDGTHRACGRTLRLPDERALLMGWCAAGGARGTDPGSSRVRYANARIAEVVEFATDRSAAFRDLLAALDASTGVVYIAEGSCREGSMRGCVHVAHDSGGRILVVHVDPRQSRTEVARQLAHELQHAVEIVAHRDVVDATSLNHLYAVIGYRSCIPGRDECWETRQALAVEARVLHELTASSSLDGAYFGAWTLNLEKSPFGSAAAPTEVTRIHRDQGYGLISIVLDTVERSGARARCAYVYRPDGREYLLSDQGQQPADFLTSKAVDPFTVDFEITRVGRVVATGRQMVARNGRTLTVETWAVDYDGHPTRSIAVWEKRTSDHRGTPAARQVGPADGRPTPDGIAVTGFTDGRRRQSVGR